MANRTWIREALERLEGPLLLYARRLLGDEDRARDVVQETFLKLCRQRREDVERRLEEWLYTVCRNGAFDVLRRERFMATRDAAAVGEPTEPVDGTRTPPAALERAEEGERVLASLTALPEKQQEALRLRFQGGLSYREIAAVTGESIGNVGWQIHQGLKALRARLGDGLGGAGGLGASNERRVTS